MILQNTTHITTTMVYNLSALAHEVEEIHKDMDCIFLGFCAIITSFMQVGFASLEAGAVHSKNVTNIVLKNVLDTFLCAIFYWLIGYSLAYGDGNSLFGHTMWASVGLPESKLTMWMFEFVFASTASTILSGAVAERCSFTTYMVYSSVISGFVYPVASHWAWADNGWLKTLGYKDMAGTGVVHTLGGSCSFVAATLLGPRIGRFQDGRVVDMPGHSTSLMGLGGLLLVSGFLGFNSGAMGTIYGKADSLGHILQNTAMGGAGSTITVLLLCRAGIVGEPKWAFAMTLNGVLAGLVAVCGAVDVFSPTMAFVTGVCGCLSFLLVRHLVLLLRVDDPLDAVAVHFGGGFCGVLSVALFKPDGIVFGINDNSVRQLLYNLVGGVAIVLWAVICSLVIFGSLWAAGRLRVSEESEINGLDISKHKEPAYPIGSWTVDHPIPNAQMNKSLDISKHKEPAYPIGSWTVDHPIPNAQMNKNESFYKTSPTDIIMIGQ